MAVIHVNTDLMRTLGQVFVQLNDEIQNQILPQIASSQGDLEADWQGISRQRFEQMLSDWTSSVNSLIANGDALGAHLEQTAGQFDSVDQTS
jgi:WXG100 family type VII secretion target